MALQLPNLFDPKKSSTATPNYSGAASRLGSSVSNFFSPAVNTFNSSAARGQANRTTPAVAPIQSPIGQNPSVLGYSLPNIIGSAFQPKGVPLTGQASSYQNAPQPVSTMAPYYMNAGAYKAPGTPMTESYSSVYPGGTVASTPPLTTLNGIAPGSTNAMQGAGPGMMYDGGGNLVPSVPTTPFNAGNIAPTNPTSTATSGSNTYQDILSLLQKNQEGYMAAFQKSAQEQQYEQNLVNAIKTQQDFALQQKGSQLALYGDARPTELAQAGSQQIEFNNQLKNLGNQNAVDIAGRNLGYAQTSRQIGMQGAQFGQQSNLAMAGLLKPVEVAPGSSLVSPTGQVQFQGSGMSPAQYSAQLQSWSQYYMNQGYDPGQAQQMAAQSIQQSGGGQKNSGSTVPFSYGNQPGVVAGYDFAANQAMAPYATDKQYTQKIEAILGNIPQALTPSTMDAYIKQVAPNSPLTGQMVYSASSTYGVDPHVLMAVMQNESKFGTLGAGAKTANPGNVGNVDSGATRNYGNWQSGVNATAENLAKRYVGQGSSNPDEALVQNYTQYTTDGTPYINIDKVAAKQQDLVKTTAAKPGIKIPVLYPEDVAKLRSIDVTTQNLKQIADLSVEKLGSGTVGRVVNSVKDWWNNKFQNDPKLGDFDRYRTTAINTIQALAGGSGQGLRLNDSEINTAARNIPEASDNLETAQRKIAVVQGYLNKWLNQLLPNQASNPNPSVSDLFSTAPGGGGNSDPLGLFSGGI